MFLYYFKYICMRKVNLLYSILRIRYRSFLPYRAYYYYIALKIKYYLSIKKIQS